MTNTLKDLSNSLKRPGLGELERIAHLATAQALIAQQLEDAVHAARTEGWSWSNISAPLRMTRQGAQQRYGKRT